MTGRSLELETLRQENGISGFLKRSESEYDTFGAGHAATAISAAYGMAAGRDIQGESFKVVAILGDGALTCGLAYEGLNNAGASDREIVVILNDNEMSIAPNVGARSKYLGPSSASAVQSPGARGLWSTMSRPLAGVATLVRNGRRASRTPDARRSLRGARLPVFRPLDGMTSSASRHADRRSRPSRSAWLHVITEKGRGFPGRAHQAKWHALPPGHDRRPGKQRQRRRQTRHIPRSSDGLTALASDASRRRRATAARTREPGPHLAKAHTIGSSTSGSPRAMR